MESDVLVCSGVTVSFGAVKVLHGVDMTVRRGEVHVLVGPNGAGKTTLANAITGHAPVATGEILLGGRRLDGPPWKRARRGVGRKFQVPRVFPRLSAADNLRVAGGRGEALRMPYADAGRAWGKEISHGERQQLELDMVHMTRPVLVVLDEPTAGMPAEERIRLAERIRSRKGEAAYLIVEHDLQFVRLVADRVSFLQEGRLELTGSYDEVSTHPRVISAYLGEAIESRAVR